MNLAHSSKIRGYDWFIFQMLAKLFDAAQRILDLLLLSQYFRQDYVVLPVDIDSRHVRRLISFQRWKAHSENIRLDSTTVSAYAIVSPDVSSLALAAAFTDNKEVSIEKNGAVGTAQAISEKALCI